MNFIVNTPTGNIGRHLTHLLLSEKRKVTLITRHPERVTDFKIRGAKIVQGSIDDEKVLDQAMKGGSALYWLTPPMQRRDHAIWATTAAQLAAKYVRKHNLARVIVQSSVGAQSGRGTGPVGVLSEIEKAFQSACGNVVALRAGFAMENLIHGIETITKTGILYMPLPANKSFPMVATRDIAQKAKEWITNTNWKGSKNIGVHGPADVTWNAVAEILSEGLGRRVKYCEMSLEQARKGMTSQGMAPHIVEAMIELYGAFRDGKLDPAEKRNKETTTPTSLLVFTKEVLRNSVTKHAKAA